MRLNATQLGFFLDKNIIQYKPNLKFMVKFFFLEDTLAIPGIFFTFENFLLSMD